MAEDNEQGTEGEEHDDDDTGADAEDAASKPEEGETPEQQVERMRKALKRANAEAKRLRLASKEKPKDDDIEARIKAARDEERELADTAWGKRLIRTEAKAALATAGAVNPKRAVGLLDLEDIDLDEDGEVIGLDQAIRDLRKEMPALFTGKAQGTDHKSGGKGPAKDDDKLTATERQARQLAGQL